MCFAQTSINTVLRTEFQTLRAIPDSDIGVGTNCVIYIFGYIRQCNPVRCDGTIRQTLLTSKVIVKTDAMKIKGMVKLD